MAGLVFFGYSMSQLDSNTLYNDCFSGSLLNSEVCGKIDISRIIMIVGSISFIGLLLLKKTIIKNRKAST